MTQANKRIAGLFFPEIEERRHSRAGRIPNDPQLLKKTPTFRFHRNN
jgi:hypothetical protein